MQGLLLFFSDFVQFGNRSNMYQFVSVVSKEWPAVVVYELCLVLHNKQVARELNRILFHVFRNLGESVFQMEICWHIFSHADVSDAFYQQLNMCNYAVMLEFQEPPRKCDARHLLFHHLLFTSTLHCDFY